MRGGLAIGNVLASMLFGGISSSMLADTVSLGAIKIPMMKKQGYDTEFSVCVTITSACQGVLIPPSHNMIIYAVAIGGVSVGKIFMAGLIPGIMLGIALMILCYIISIKRNYPSGGTYVLKDALKIAGESLLGLFTVVIIIGGVFAGIVTANESAVLACIWAIIVTLFFYKRITVRDLIPVLKKTLRTLVMIMTLVASATAFGYMMTILRIPELITTGLLGITSNKYLLLLLINLALLALGCVMDITPIILITAPILVRVVTSPAVGMDPIHFGIVMMLNLSIGFLTPPIGTALMVGSSIGCIKIEQTIRSMAPFYIVMITALMLITFIPAISMTIPNLMYGR
jgi:tripartite ATP-independent transporter DctM subunit